MCSVLVFVRRFHRCVTATSEPPFIGFALKNPVINVSTMSYKDYFSIVFFFVLHTVCHRVINACVCFFHCNLSITRLCKWINPPVKVVMSYKLCCNCNCNQEQTTLLSQKVCQKSMWKSVWQRRIIMFFAYASIAEIINVLVVINIRLHLILFFLVVFIFITIVVIVVVRHSLCSANFCFFNLYANISCKMTQHTFVSVFSWHH